ncbi:citrate-binding protein-like [Brachypodium distachyon]|uniref:citrate-binding protein-like n=1 Tax=Brachypodium distachyon TaxID=15368 RepID=UPI000234F420|nr:citrate-binding protein-like [Brachypodium distachyon]|eukprot:XP_024310821.1 citrate-binding protein-like [Brachypodium distachyon]
MASSSLSALLLLLAVVVGTAAARGGDDGKDPLTTGFRPVRLTESQFIVQKPYDVPLRDRYEHTGGVRRMWVFSTDKSIRRNHPGGARTEIKINVVYRSGVWQFTGEVYVPTGTSGVSIMQIFGARPERQATTLMLHVYDGRLTFYHDLRRVLADDIYDRWVRLNVVHDIAAGNVTVFVDGVERLRSRSHGSQDAPHYFKFGVYKQSHNHPSHRMESRWRNVQVFTKP